MSVPKRGLSVTEENAYEPDDAVVIVMVFIISISHEAQLEKEQQFT